MQKDSLIYVAGHRGLVGSAICRKLKQQGFDRLLVRSHAELDLTDRDAVLAFFERERRNTSFSPRPKWAAFSQTISTLRTSSAKT